MTLVAPAANALADASYVGHLLVLPTGQIMFTDFSTNVEVFTPAGTYNPAWAPTISSASTSLARAKTYTVSGAQFNGLSQGSAYGDDFQNATNYPLVRIVNAATGHVVYCRTHNHSTMAIATGSKKVSTQFDVQRGQRQASASCSLLQTEFPRHRIGLRCTSVSGRHGKGTASAVPC